MGRPRRSGAREQTRRTKRNLPRTSGIKTKAEHANSAEARPDALFWEAIQSVTLTPLTGNLEARRVAWSMNNTTRPRRSGAREQTRRTKRNFPRTSRMKTKAEHANSAE